jgi:hypothetical protein
MVLSMTWSGTFHSAVAAKYESKADACPLAAGVAEKDTSDSFMFTLAAVNGRQNQACQYDRCKTV